MNSVHKSIVPRTLSQWIKTLRMWRVLAQEFASNEGDEQFVGNGIDAILADLDSQYEPRQWNTYRLKSETGRTLVLKLEMYIDSEENKTDGE